MAERGLLFASTNSGGASLLGGASLFFSLLGGASNGARTLPSRLPAPHLISDPPLFGRPVDV